MKDENVIQNTISLKRIVIISVVLLAIAFLVAYLKQRSEIVKENHQLIDNGFDGTIMYTYASFDSDMDYINSLLERKYLSDAQKGILYSQKSFLYHNQNETLNYYSNVGYALFYLEKSKNIEDRMRLYNDLCAYYLEHEAYDKLGEVVSELTQLSAGGFRLRDFEAYSRYYKYKACYEAFQGKYEEAHRDFEKARQKLNYEDSSKKVQEAISMINLQEANCYLREGKFHLGYSILKRYPPMNISNNTPNVRYYVSEFQLPYYELLFRCAQHKNEVKAQSLYLDKYFYYCNKYDFSQKRMSLFSVYLTDEKLLDEEMSREFFSSSVEAYKQAFDSNHDELMEISDSILDDATLKIQNEAYDVIKHTITCIIIGFCVVIFMIIVVFVYIVSRQSLMDKLTGVRNRRDLDNSLKKFAEKESMISAIMFDIDDFKVVNDKHGHEIGDYVLKQIGSILNTYNSSKWQAYRYGGEEFVILSTVKSPDDIVNMAETIRKSIESFAWEYDLKITVSVGVARNCKIDGIIQTADKNLYHVKRNGKNNVCYSINEKLVLLN